ncbi:hypothetical protein IKP85_02615 [bacterium]|nr:hypothetical protein [bacterium]
MTKNSIEKAENLKKLVNPEQNTVKNKKIKVIGVGTGGCNAVNHMIKCGLADVEFWLMNTDKQLLELGRTDNRILLGVKTTKGLGAGDDYEIWKQAAEESKHEIIKALEGADMVIITTGLGGGTGTGATPVIAKIAKELGILTVAVVTKPFTFEGKRRTTIAEEGIKNLKQYFDKTVIIENDKLLQVVKRTISINETFDVTNRILSKVVIGLLKHLRHQ